ncbi:HTH-type transcriptional regulator IscR [Planctomycetes bacterium CA13]|uniref:HTH-type transcriptional regulator IscR n=1 Tax=Novipirellula herctigrandis TaxID=2527986 RepID=A0A5C5Z5A3_9BACT|nr:HTH-type transcriptional regulator IscR [Planctomycetes bacterium CA13]
MISQTAEYALRAIVCLADQAAPKTTAAIADQTRVPAGYLAKVMQGLSRSGVVHAQRGLHGGFVLVRPADQLTVIDVINAVDPIRRFHECPLGLHGIHLCQLHRKLDNTAKRIEEDLGKTTIADLIDSSTQSKPLCGFPLSDLPESKQIESKITTSQ